MSTMEFVNFTDQNEMIFRLPGFLYAMIGTEVEAFTLIKFVKVTYNLNTQDGWQVGLKTI